MRKLTILIVWLLLIGAVSYILSDTASSQNWGKKFGDTGIYFALRLAYIERGLSGSTMHKDLFRDNFQDFIAMNPSPVQSATLRSAMGFFIHLLQPFYILGIIVASFYLIFISSSPGKRYRIKSMLTKLLAGMIVISLSPAILQLFFSLSGGLTRVILGLTDVNIFLTAMDDILSSMGTFFTVLAYINVSLSFYAMLPLMLIVWGTFSIFFLRYAIITMFCIIFPLAVFLYSFEFTRALGRNMLEQMILWTLIQELNAVVLAAITVCIATRPESFMIIESLIADVDILALSSCIVFIMTPLLVLRLFRNFLP